MRPPSQQRRNLALIAISTLSATFLLAPASSAAQLIALQEGPPGEGDGIAPCDDRAASKLITLSVGQVDINEGDGLPASVTVTATLSGEVPRCAETTVTLDASLGGTAEGGGVDYSHTALPSSVTIAADGLSGSASEFSVTPVDDRLTEGDETITLGGSVRIGDFTVIPATITLADDDVASTSLSLSVNPSSLGESAASTPVTVTATLDGGTLSSDTTVTLTLGGTATAGTDYADPGTLPSITITAGQISAAAMIDIDPAQDSVDEGTGETVIVGGTATGGLRVNSATIGLPDDDTVSSTITLSATPSSVNERDAGTAVAIEVRATLGSGVTRAVDTTVSLSLSGSATGGTDYTATLPSPPHVVIPAGQTTGIAAIGITPQQDSATEPGGETIRVDGTAVESTVFTTVNSTVITIVDDDTESTSLTLTTNRNAALAESAVSTPVTVTATLDGGTLGAETTVTLGLSGSAVAGTDYTVPASLLDSNIDLTITGGQLSAEASFTIGPIDDTIDEGAGETITVGGTASSGGTALAVTGADIELSDNDTASSRIALSVNDDDVGETEATAAVMVTATLQGDISRSQAAPVDLSMGGSAALNADYTLTPTSPVVEIAAGQLTGSAVVNITPVDDTMSEGNETIDIAGTLEGFTVAGATVNLIDDDSRPPAAVADLAATRSGRNSMRLSWSAPGTPPDRPLTGYRLQRHPGDGVWADVAVDIDPAHTSYLDRSLAYRTDYTWRLFASNADGESAVSNEATAATGSRPVHIDPIVPPRADNVVIVASAYNAADLVIAAAIAACIPGATLIYKGIGEVEEDVSALLGRYRPDKIIFVGDLVALDAGVIKQVHGVGANADVNWLGGADRIETAAAAARLLLGNPQDFLRRTVVIASSRSSADAAVAAVLAARTANSVVLFTEPDALPEATRAVIGEYRPVRVVVIGGSAAADAAVADAAAAAAFGIELERIGGADRIETAAAAARLLLGNPQEFLRRTVVIASSRSSADAAVAAVLAARAANSVVLFTEPGALPEATRAVVAEYQPVRVVVIGGTSAVSESVYDALADAAPAAQLERIGGADRVETAARAARRIIWRLAP